jgi:D-amino peptidase
MHPADACDLIRAQAEAAIADLSSAELPQITLPATLSVTFRNSDLAETASWIAGVSRSGTTTVTISDEDPINLFRTFINTVRLTRDIAE